MAKIQWQPISFLPQIAIMISGMLDASKETYESLSKIKVHDDFTIQRIFEVTGTQVEDEWLYDEQLARWLQLKSLKPEQQAEITNLQKQMSELKKANRKILAIAEKHKTRTIEKVLSKSDADVAMDFLMGKLT